MKKILLIAVTFAITHANAQLCFNNPASYSVGSGPVSVCSADFNADGAIDLAAVNDTSNTVSILLNNGTGSFLQAASILVGSQPRWVISNDFNGDAKADLAVANYVSSDISLLYGNGSGGFSTPVTYTLNPMAMPTSLISADFNSDGKVDLATCNYGNTSVTVLLGNGSGFTDTTLSSWVMSSMISSLAVVDFDGDNFLDIVAATAMHLNILYGDGAGHFPASYNISMFSSSKSTVISPDLNSDGMNDLIACDGGSGNTYIYLSSSSGMNPGPLGCSIPGQSCYPYFFMSTADFNGDSILDLAAVSNCQDSIVIYLGTGTGSFGSPTRFSAGNTPFNLTNSDFNGDGMTDIAVVNDDSQSISVLMQCTPACFASITDSLFNISPLNWGVIANYSSLITSAIWYWGDGTSTIGLYPSHTYTAAGLYSICVTAYASCGDSAIACLNDSLYRTSNNSSMITVDVQSGVNNIGLFIKDSDKSIYPNPTAGKLVIPSSIHNSSIIDIYDVSGCHVFNKIITGETEINLDKLSDGVYTLVIKGDYGNIIRKLIIAR